MTSLHTPGPWRVGKGGCVVSETPCCPAAANVDDIGYYGGYLICESIGTRHNAELMARAPDYAEVLGYPGFRSLGLVLVDGTWQYEVQIALASNVVNRFYGLFADEAVAAAACALRNARNTERDIVRAEVRAQLPVALLR